MPSRKRLITLGLAVFAIGVLLSFPARVAYHLFAPEQLKLSAISGTLWSGKAAEGQAASLYLQNLEWSFRPLALFTGKLAFDTRLDPAGGFLQTQVALGFGGRVMFTDLDGAVPINALQGLLPAPGIGGNARLQFSELTIDDGLPVAADGTLDVQALSIRGLSPTPVGDFRAELSTTEDGISGSVEDLAGMLDIAAALKVASDRSVSLVGLVAPTPATPQTLNNQLRFLGSANERGQREFRFEGEIPR